MSETDRIARLESVLTGLNAWNTGRQWEETHRDLIYRHRDGTPRTPYWNMEGLTERQSLIRFSDTLTGCHRSLMAHIRDYDPLHRDDWRADTMIGLMRDTDPMILRLYPDDPQGFRDLWTLLADSSDGVYNILHEPESSLLNDRDSFACHWWVNHVTARMREFLQRSDMMLRRLSRGAYSLDDDCCDIMPVVSVRRYEDGILVDRQMDVPNHAIIRVEPDSLDWRHRPNVGVYGTIGMAFPYRANDGHQWETQRRCRSPRRFAGMILRSLRMADELLRSDRL
ncbi:hypothetical protein [Bifidobacterium sp. SO1]|uniref:hypothetical protein n=1 Tax=Bifidobacterium sp. SO1 TaxID=2809029 RepID=UPI001BDC8011|nr:hypothetical protein [Bifidobacterium sp. SO1]MBT1162802.1 hypothetical protein [Bifidobacterium sp. SO1]